MLCTLRFLFWLRRSTKPVDYSMYILARLLRQKPFSLLQFWQLSREMKLTNGVIVDYSVSRVQGWGKPSCWTLDTDSIIYQQAVMRNVQNKKEVFIRHRIRLLVLSSIYQTVFRPLFCIFFTKLLYTVSIWKTDLNLVAHRWPHELYYVTQVFSTF